MIGYVCERLDVNGFLDMEIALYSRLDDMNAMITTELSLGFETYQDRICQQNSISPAISEATLAE